MPLESDEDQTNKPKGDSHGVNRVAPRMGCSLRMNHPVCLGHAGPSIAPTRYAKAFIVCVVELEPASDEYEYEHRPQQRTEHEHDEKRDAKTKKPRGNLRSRGVF